MVSCFSALPLTPSLAFRCADAGDAPPAPAGEDEGRRRCSGLRPQLYSRVWGQNGPSCVVFAPLPRQGRSLGRLTGANARQWTQRAVGRMSMTDQTSHASTRGVSGGDLRWRALNCKGCASCRRMRATSCRACRRARSLSPKSGRFRRRGARRLRWTSWCVPTDLTTATPPQPSCGGVGQNHDAAAAAASSLRGWHS